MLPQLEFDIHAQPDDNTCGPTCLHAVYRYFDEDLPLRQVIAEVPRVDGGGTIAVLLACHALERGYDARIYTYNLSVFDPTWFTRPGVDLADRLERQRAAKDDPKLYKATEGYLRFLELGGELRFEDLSARLIRKYLRKGLPILTGLSSTYLYRAPREFGPNDDPDDIRGSSMGHFVVLAGYDSATRSVRIADPFLDNPYADGHHYSSPIERVVCAVLLGVLTYDANLLLLEPPADTR